MRARLFLLLLAASGCGSLRQTTAPAEHPAGAVSAQITRISGRPFAVRVSSHGIVYITQQDENAIATFNLASGVHGPSIGVGADPGDVVFDRTGATAFVSAFHGGSVHVIDVASGRQIAAIPIASNAYRLVLSADDATLFVSSTNGRVYAMDVARRRVTTSVQLRGAIQGLALAPSGRSIFAASTNGSVWKLDAATLQVLATRSPGGNLQDIAVASAENEVYVASETGWIEVLDASSLVPVTRILLDGMAPFGLALTRDEAQIYVTSPRSGDVAIVDRRARTLVKTIRVSGMPRRVAFDATGAIAVVANEGNWVDVIR